VGGSVLDVSVRPGPDGLEARLGPARR
jgi:hypothetical protein